MNDQPNKKPASLTPAEKLAWMLKNSQLEEALLGLCDSAQAQPGASARWVSIARTHFQEGIMALDRAIFNPPRFSELHKAQNDAKSGSNGEGMR